MAATLLHFPRCIAGITLTSAILAAPRTPHLTTCGMQVSFSRQWILDVNGLRQTRNDWTEGLPPVSRRNDLWIEEVARMGSRRGRRATLHQTLARTRDQFLRYGGYVFSRRKRGDPRTRAKGLWTGARSS